MTDVLDVIMRWTWMLHTGHRGEVTQRKTIASNTIAALHTM